MKVVIIPSSLCTKIGLFLLDVSDLWNLEKTVRATVDRRPMANNRACSKRGAPVSQRVSLEDLSNPVRAVFFVTRRATIRSTGFLFELLAEGFFHRGDPPRTLSQKLRSRAVVSQNFSRAYSRLLYN